MASPPVSLAFGSRLNALSWATTLRRLPSLSALSGPGWQRAFGGTDVTIDLSAVRFADFVTLGLVLNLVDALAAADALVVVRLPNSEPLAGEQATARDPDAPAAQPDSLRSAGPYDVARWQRQRLNCRLFMRQAGFERALRDGPWDWRETVHLDEGELPAAAERTEPRKAAGDPDREGAKAPHRLRRILPYQWLTPLADSDGTYAGQLNHLTAMLSGIGLSSEDATTLAQGVLAELVENVAQHAQAPHGRLTTALVGGLVVEAEHYSSRVDDFSPHLRGFVRRAASMRSPLVRLVVGDSGAGLLSARPVAATEAAPAGTSVAERDPIHAAFGWSGPSSTLRDLGRPARGLWKVARIVRTFPGSVLVGTSGRVAGYLFDDSGQPEEIPGGPAPWLPGTFVECDVLVGNDRAADRTTTSLSPSRGAPGSPPRLVCTNVELHRGAGAAPGAVEQLGRLLAMPANRRLGGLVVSVDTADGDREPSGGEIRRLLSEVLDIAGGSPTPAAMVVVFPRASRGLLSIAVDDLNLRFDRTSGQGPAGNPVLVLGQGSRQYWVGGSEDFRRVLSGLSSDPSEVSPAQVASALGLDPRGAGIVREIRSSTRWVDVRAGTVRLRLRPEDALRALADDLARRLTEAVAAADIPGVESGRFLTPNLRIATRWCDVGAMLAHLRAEQLASLLLAGRFDDQVRPPDRARLRLVVLRVGNPTHELTSNFARSLTGDDFYYDSVAGIDIGGDGELRSEAAVVLFTDLVSTTKSVYHELSLLRARGISPLAVVTVLDTRPVHQSRRKPDELAFGDVRPRLISLAAVDVEAHDIDPAAEPVPIDPVSDLPATLGRPRPRALVLQPAYLDALAKTGAARLGHIDRPGGRHYTGYVDPTMLFADRAWANQVVRLACNRIEEAHRAVVGRDPDDGADSLGILFPSDTDDIEQVAWLLASELDRRGLRVEATVPVPRAVRGAKWRFPTTLPLRPNVSHVVVVDSGTVSGRSVQQLVRLASGPEVRAVTAVILLNGLNDLDAIAVQQVRAVDSFHGPRPTTADHRDIAVTVHFVARTAIDALDSRECPVCRLRADYASIHRTVPASIDEHRAWLLKTLALRPKEQVFAEEPTDLMGMPIGQEDCIEYLRWRAMLREAQYDTIGRHDLVSAIDVVDTDPTRRNSLVRLLTAEWQWLDMTPLWWPEVRRSLAEIALSMVVGPAAWHVDPALRIQAINLLIRTDPQLYVARIVDIFLSNHGQRLVIDQLIIETLLLVSQVDGHRRFSPAALVEGLATLEDRLRQLGDEQRSPVPLDEVRYMFAVSRRLLHRPPSDPQAAWKTLRRLRAPVIEHAYDGPIWRLQAMLTNLARGLPPWSAESARGDWERCGDFLGMEVLPCLEPLRNVMLSMRITNGMSAEDAAMWARVVNGDGSVLLDETRHHLWTVLAHRPRDSDTTEATIERAATSIRWWSRFFLAAHPDPEHLDRGAFLTEVVNQCPASLLDIAHAVFEDCDCEYELEDVPDSEPLNVFCTDSLVRDVLTHIRVNAESKHRSGGGAQRFSLRVRRRDTDAIELIVRNTDSQPTAHAGGRGLATLKLELSRFGADLGSSIDVDHPWTYETSIRLQRWRAE